MTLRLYGLAPGRYESARGLREWERDWLLADLPPAPGRVLVTAAGSGREVKALEELGYVVDAFEPVATMVDACRRVATTGKVIACDYDDFCRSVERGVATGEGFADTPYDAVLLGWGSLTHVLRPEDRRRIVRAACTVAPGGPVLASFFAFPDAAGPPEPGRAHRAGGTLGRFIGRRREGVGDVGNCGFYWHLGLTHTFTGDEVRELAHSVDREAAFVATPYGHATFRGRS